MTTGSKMKMIATLALLVGGVSLLSGCGRTGTEHGREINATGSNVKGDWTAVSMTIDGTRLPACDFLLHRLEAYATLRLRSKIL